MEMLIIILGIYGVINLFSALFLSFDIAYFIDETEWRRFLIFPMIWEGLRCDLNITGSVIAISLFAIGLLPAIVALYIVQLFRFLIRAIVGLFKEVFKKEE